MKDRLAHNRRYALDSTKTRAFGWEPEQSYREAIAKTVDWYKENQDWWGKIKAKKHRIQEIHREELPRG